MVTRVKRVIYPPIWLVFGLVAVFALNEYCPGPRFSGEFARWAGGIIILSGLLLLAIANGLFARAGTDAIPFRKVSTLVTGGVYRFTRNPMYLGMALTLLGCAVTVGASYALPVPLLFAIIVQQRFILPEEALLQQLFPEEYPAYCRRVRRWL